MLIPSPIAYEFHLAASLSVNNLKQCLTFKREKKGGRSNYDSIMYTTIHKVADI